MKFEGKLTGHIPASFAAASWFLFPCLSVYKHCYNITFNTFNLSDSVNNKVITKSGLSALGMLTAELSAESSFTRLM